MSCSWLQAAGLYQLSEETWINLMPGIIMSIHVQSSSYIHN